MKLTTAAVVFCVVLSLLYPRAEACPGKDDDRYLDFLALKLEELDKIAFGSVTLNRLDYAGAHSAQEWSDKDRDAYRTKLDLNSVTGFADVNGKKLADSGFGIRSMPVQGLNVQETPARERKTSHGVACPDGGFPAGAGTSFPSPLYAGLRGPRTTTEFWDTVLSDLEKQAFEEARKAAREVNIKDIQELNFNKSQITCHGEFCKIVRGARCTLAGGLNRGECLFYTTLSFNFTDTLTDNAYIKIECEPVKSRPGFVQSGSCRLHVDIVDRVNMAWFVAESLLKHGLTLEYEMMQLGSAVAPKVLAWYERVHSKQLTFTQLFQRLDEWLSIVTYTTQRIAVLGTRFGAAVLLDVSKLMNRTMWFVSFLVLSIYMIISLGLFWLWMRLVWKVCGWIFGFRSTHKKTKKTCEDCGIELPDSL